MKQIISILFVMISLQLSAQNLSAGKAEKSLLQLNGSGDFKTIQGAINSLPDSSATPRTIYIKKGA